MQFFAIVTREESSSRSIPMHLRNVSSSRSWSGVDMGDSVRQTPVSALLRRQEKHDLARCRASGRQNDGKTAIRGRLMVIASAIAQQGTHEASGAFPR